VSALLVATLLVAGAPAENSRADTDACAGAEAAVNVAAESLDKGRWDEAERILEPLAASHESCRDVVLGQARVRAARGDPAGAERLFIRATTLAPGDARAQALLAQHALAQGQHARADYLSTLALSLDPDCALALVVQGQILRGKGRMPEAREVLERAVRLDPANAEARYQLGICLFRSRLHPEAVVAFEKAAALRPPDARAHDYLALSLEALGQAEAAELAYRAALKVNQGPFFDSFLDYNVGRFFLKQDRLAESRSHLDRAVELAPDGRAPVYERAKLNLAQKDYAAARRDAERALALVDPSGLVLDLQVYYLLSAVYSRMGESELARKYAELARTTPIPDQARDRPR
jgi:tetratricopeptide (TPR) repeat protein